MATFNIKVESLENEFGLFSVSDFDILNFNSSLLWPGGILVWFLFVVLLWEIKKLEEFLSRDHILLDMADGVDEPGKEVSHVDDLSEGESND